MSSRGEERKNREEERGKGEEQSELDEGFICRMTYSTGSWHEPVLKVCHESVLKVPFSNSTPPGIAFSV